MADDKAAARKSAKLIPKRELIKIKKEVSRLRKQGHDIWTDDEIEKAGWTTDVVSSGLHVNKEKQRQTWDCGLACARMVLLTLDEGAPSYDVLAARVASPSVWTIDLAYLLSEFGVTCEFISAAPTMDVASYSGSAFYAESLAEDAGRVQRLLAKAAQENVVVRKATLSAAELWNLMSEEETLVIALVDATLLHNRAAASRAAAAAAAAAAAKGKATPPSSVNYLGHYVLIVGLDDGRGGFVVNDPARDDERTFVHAETLEAARCAEGTDQDLILVPIYEQSTGPTVPPPGEVPKIVRVCGSR